jgi:hypothetical protein
MERIKEIPAITFDAVQLFTEHDSAKLAALMEEEKRQEAAQRDAWAEIVTAEGFAAFEFVQRCEYPMTLILHPSTRPGVDWQLTRIGWDGIPNGHDDFYKSDMEALYKELADYGRRGVTVRACYVD